MHDTHLTKAYLSEIISRSRDHYKVPAMCVSVMNEENIYLQEIQGIKVYNKQDIATFEDYFHIGSCSKTVLAIIAEKLIQEKKISWTTKFLEVFPELKSYSNPSYRNITLQDLFLCRAGIKSYTNLEKEPLPDFVGSSSSTQLQFLKYLINQPPSSKETNLNFQHLYSNASYAMSSAMLEKVSNLDYEKLVKRTLEKGFGISAYIGWPNKMDAKQPWGHTIKNGNIKSYPPDHPYKVPRLILPAGDLSMSTRDYATYTQMHLRGLRGNDNYISSAAYKNIHFCHNGFALGVANGKLSGKLYSGFDGTAGTFFCRSILVPGSDFALTIITNAGSGEKSMEVVDWLTINIIKKHFNWWWKIWL